MFTARNALGRGTAGKFYWQTMQPSAVLLKPVYNSIYGQTIGADSGKGVQFESK